MVELFTIHGRSDLANLFDGFNKKISHDPENILSNILASYGGMGSLNDVVLYKNGQPLIKENNELDELRKFLYSFCREKI